MSYMISLGSTFIAIIFVPTFLLGASIRGPGTDINIIIYDDDVDNDQDVISINSEPGTDEKEPKHWNSTT